MSFLTFLTSFAPFSLAYSVASACFWSFADRKLSSIIYLDELKRTVRRITVPKNIGMRKKRRALDVLPQVLARNAVMMYIMVSMDNG